MQNTHDNSNQLRGIESLRLWTELWQELLDAFPSAKVNQGTSGAYLRLLQDLKPDDLRAAIAQVASTHRFSTLPTVAQIREAAGCLGDQTEDTAMDIYGATMRELSIARAEARIPQLDPIAREVVKAMGGSWMLLQSDNGPADRAQFRDTYNAKLKQRQTEAAVVPAARAIVGEPVRREIQSPAVLARPRTDAECQEARRRIDRRRTVYENPECAETDEERDWVRERAQFLIDANLTRGRGFLRAVDVTKEES